ncbi:carbohydrate ABC transporter permease [Scopulibacillus cellulosilyticus]|uniref:Carbohydrate ABC transporter permease n=1 Tax=Scopulibacillus cellulosilyticus TaxID=2665665 RepID=A0ABW2PXT5_9BACL
METEKQYEYTQANVLSKIEPKKLLKTKKPFLSGFVVYFILIVYFIIIAYPLLWMVMNSFRSSKEILGDSWGFPKEFLIQNYVDAWQSGIAGYFLNSVIVTVATCVLTVLISAMGAYAFSRFQFKGKNILLIFCLGGLMLSPQVSLIPLYKLMQALHIYNTYWAMILPYVAYRIPFTLLLIRAYFLSIPKELEESASLDGCSNLQIFTKIFLPLSKPVLMTATVMTGYFAWNEFMFAIVFVDNDKLRTIPAGLMQFRDALQTNWGVLLAGLTISALPIVILFLFAQKYFIRGMASGSIKG